MNHSFYSADRTTHLKIVVVALVAAIGVAGVGISARLSADDGLTQTARVMRPRRQGQQVRRHDQHRPGGDSITSSRIHKALFPAPEVAL